MTFMMVNCLKFYLSILKLWNKLIFRKYNVPLSWFGCMYACKWTVSILVINPFVTATSMDE